MAFTLLSGSPSMKTLARLAAFLLVAAAAFPALAQQEERVKAELRKKVPEAPIDSVRKIPFGNLYEVVVNGEIVYTDQNATFLMIGSIVDLAKKENITEQRNKELSRIEFASLPLDNAIKIVRGNGSRKVAMFADPNCGYCKRFERDLLGVTDITVYVFLYPILSPDSTEKSKAVWCSADRGKAWIDLMVRNTQPTASGKCDTPIEKILAWGQARRVQGTPTLFFEDGDRVPGVMPVAELEKKLTAAKGAPAKVSAR